MYRLLRVKIADWKQAAKLAATAPPASLVQTSQAGMAKKNKPNASKTGEEEKKGD